MNTHPATRSARNASQLLADAPHVDQHALPSTQARQLLTLKEAPAITLEQPVLGQLALSFGWCQRAKEALADGTVTGASRGRVEREIEARHGHLELLLAGVHRLIRQIVHEKVTARYGPSWGDALMEDVLAEAYAVAVAAAADFDQSKNVPFASYLAQRVRAAVGDAAFRHAASGNMQQSWQRLARVTAAVEQTLHAQLQRTPTDQEVQEAVESAMRDWALERIDPDLEGDERDAAIRAKLIKQGTWGALGDIAELRRISAGEVRLDRPVGDDESMTVGMTLADNASVEDLFDQDVAAGKLAAVLQLAVSELEPALAAQVLSRLDGDGSDGRGSAAVAVRNLRRRIVAPHLQYAALAPHLDEPIVEEVAPSWERKVSQLVTSTAN